MTENIDYQKAHQYISSLKKFGSKLGLDRIKILLDIIKNPQKKLNFIHIAGTNGKGSTTMFCSNILINAGYKTGGFFSPHIINFRERFQVDNQMITEDEFAWITNTIKPVIENLKNDNIIITEFEALTAIGFAFFIYKKCDFVCLETGLGGTLDATNIIPPPVASIITSISIDHTDRLGETISEITENKVGIIKENSPVIIYPKNTEEILEIIYKKASTLSKSTVILPSISSLIIEKMDLYGSEFIYDGYKYRINLVGEHQIYNAITAIEAINTINIKSKYKNLNKKKFSISNKNITNGLAESFIPARMEKIKSSPNIYIDGAHNIDGILKLKDTLKFITGKKACIFGVLSNKNYQDMLKILSEEFSHIIFINIENHSSVNTQSLLDYTKNYNIEACSLPSYKDLLEYINTIYKKDKTFSFVVCGSLYLASDIRKFIKDTI